MSTTLMTTLLLGLLTGLLMWIGQLLGGTQGLAVFFVFAVVMNFGSYWFSDRIVLAAYGARELPEQDAPDLFRIVRELAVAPTFPSPQGTSFPARPRTPSRPAGAPEQPPAARPAGPRRPLPRRT